MKIKQILFQIQIEVKTKRGPNKTYKFDAVYGTFEIAKKVVQDEFYLIIFQCSNIFRNRYAIN